MDSSVPTTTTKSILACDPDWMMTTSFITLVLAVVRGPRVRRRLHAEFNSDSLDRLAKLSVASCHAVMLLVKLVDIVFRKPDIYDALSYTWGGQEAECVIYCGSKRLLVTNNLFLAIARLRLPDDDRFIWADAVCIDQKNTPEKTDQVLLMKEVYQGAQRVIIWLGGDEGNSHSAIALLERLAKVLRHRRQLHQDDTNVPTPLDAGQEVVSLLQKDRTLLGLPPSHDPSYNALSELFERPYFRRMWIVQEVVMACETQVLCGTSSVMLTWDDLAAVMRHIPDLAAYTRTIPSALELGQLIERTRSAVDHGHARRLALSKLLSRHNCSQATEPKDNVIGVIGMTSSRLNIRIDYSQDTSDFFRSVAVKVLKEDGNLDILGDIDHGVELTQTRNGAGDSGTASWVPHWQTSRALVSESSDTTRLADYGPFKSCGEYISWDASVRDEQGGMGLLDVEGYRLDSIAKVGGYMEEFVDFTQDDYIYDDWERRVVDVYSHGSDSLYSLTSETILEVYWRTIYLGKTPPDLE
ncbi:hypothetical protein CHU98_g2386 [Xylaria longipes]|nr:hypothetical protein CHU98_g2386 [Xylaria longipes]